MINRILGLMNAKGINAKQLTTELEISNSSVTDWKKGSKPSCDVIIKLASYFKVTTDYLLLGTECASAPVSDDSDELLSIYKNLDKDGKRILMGKALDLRDTHSVFISREELKEAK